MEQEIFGEGAPDFLDEDLLAMDTAMDDGTDMDDLTEIS